MGEKTYKIRELTVYDGVLSVVVFGNKNTDDGVSLTMEEIREFIELSVGPEKPRG